jgi:dUTP pyrophosphatase
VKIKLLTDTAIAPTYATDGSAGMDLYADGDYEILVNGDFVVVSTGISVEIDADKTGLVWPRSGMAARYGIATGAGVIDSDYRGELKVLLFNHGDLTYLIKRGDRIAQLLIVPCYRPKIEAVDHLDETARGVCGFGSSGK